MEYGRTVRFVSIDVTELDRLDDGHVDCPEFVAEIDAVVELAGVHLGVERSEVVDVAVHILAGTKITDMLDALEDETCEASTAEAE